MGNKGSTKDAPEKVLVQATTELRGTEFKATLKTDLSEKTNTYLYENIRAFQTLFL